MLVAELIKEVAFEEVKKELVITSKGFEKVLSQFENYYEGLKNTELSLEPQHSKIQVSREYFDVSYFIGTEKKDAVEDVTTFVPAELILASQVADEDLVDLEKPLIVSGLLCLLTFNGTCFSEEERQAEVDSLKQHIADVNE
ncbi:hypothetical protein CVD28_00010 [Bacillus sp. M6-12]|uniref:DUF6557 family protein n=1 Tax=Bacillus sp. M6-12 TaxID=2054166 RepID=UPI000C793C1F|nr:DUF6557 family protein [Bacillus sp. M6-12]PLS18823.1 hypothetical protein CVD28_00010 [Bacillus sp. M6-12]